MGRNHRYGIDLSCEDAMIVYDSVAKGERGRGAARLREYTYSWLASRTPVNTKGSDVVNPKHDSNKIVRNEGELEPMRMRFWC